MTKVLKFPSGLSEQKRISSELYDELWGVIMQEKYTGQMLRAGVVGILELIKYDLMSPEVVE